MRRGLGACCPTPAQVCRWSTLSQRARDEAAHTSEAGLCCPQASCRQRRFGGNLLELSGVAGYTNRAKARLPRLILSTFLDITGGPSARPAGLSGGMVSFLSKHSGFARSVRGITGCLLRPLYARCLRFAPDQTLGTEVVIQ